jgi:hypothetical protein
MNTHIQPSVKILVLSVILCLTGCVSAAEQKEKVALIWESSSDVRYIQWSGGMPFYAHAVRSGRYPATTAAMRLSNILTRPPSGSSKPFRAILYLSFASHQEIKNAFEKTGQRYAVKLYREPVKLDSSLNDKRYTRLWI